MSRRWGPFWRRNRDRRIHPHSDRRRPWRFLIGWASARGLQVVADKEPGSTAPVNISKEKSDTYPFPIYTHTPEDAEPS